MSDYTEGIYYLVVPVDGEETLKECNTRREAERIFTEHYENGHSCQWKGLWDGTSFVDKRPPIYLKGNYYFRILTEEYPIPISRKTKEEAFKTFKLYQSLSGECKWLGQWDGERFVDQEEPD